MISFKYEVPFSVSQERNILRDNGKKVATRGRSTYQANFVGWGMAIMSLNVIWNSGLFQKHNKLKSDMCHI